jgi:hypothetical protein
LVAGPALAGLLIAVAGLELTYALDAATFVVSLLAAVIRSAARGEHCSTSGYVRGCEMTTTNHTVRAMGNPSESAR